jgi:Protein of unknown function (DUF4238)
MARDHYIPAALIGRFSTEAGVSSRKRRVWVYGGNRPAPTFETAESVGFRNNYYKMAPVYDRMVEDAWNQYENKITRAINELADPTVGSVDGRTWLRVLVPFVAGTFIRTPDFVRKFQTTIGGQIYPDDPEAQSDNNNVARLMALQRSLAPVMAAEWVVIATVGSEPLITSDVGYSTFVLGTNRNKFGWAIPLDPTHVLMLYPCPDGHGRKIMFHTGDTDSGWRAFIGYDSLAQDNHRGLNAATSRLAHDYIVGPTRESVLRHSQYMGERKDDHDHNFNPTMLTSHRMQIVHEFEWHRLVEATTYDFSDDRMRSFELSFKSGEKSEWYPPTTMIPANLPRFTTGLSLRGRTITLEMSEVKGFTDGSPGPFPWEG